MALVLAGVCLSGCVERRLKITSDPPGALVYLANDEVGRTPLTMPFTWYGDYEVILRLEGYEAKITHTNITPPIYDIPPWDLISQAFVPWTYRYNVSRHYELTPLTPPTEAELIERAMALRERNLQPVPK